MKTTAGRKGAGRGWLPVLAAAALAVCLAGPALGRNWLPGPRAMEKLLAQIPPDCRRDANTTLDLVALLAAYPKAGLWVGRDQAGRVFVAVGQGPACLYDDGLAKSFEQKLAKADLEDMLALVYPAGPFRGPAPARQDPGRMRCLGFFKALYGAGEQSVKKSLVTVALAGHHLRFNRRQGAAEALGRVAAGLSGLAARSPAVRPYLARLGGGFLWRYIAGTRNLSAHSFGIAMDLNPARAVYWRWKHQGRAASRAIRNFPPEILAAFENEGFIWGGKWRHFDTMHFEYRPELFVKAALLAGRQTLPAALR